MANETTNLPAVLPRLFAACLLAGGMAACNEAGGDRDGDDKEDGADDGDGDGDGSGDDGEQSDCQSNSRFFEDEVQTILQANCQSCHNNGGDAKHTKFILQSPSGAPDYLERNLAVFTEMSRLRFDGTPWILLKPTGGLEHGGGVRFQDDSDEYIAFQEMIERIAEPVVCDDEEDIVLTFFEGVDQLDEVQTLRKAMILIMGRLPTAEEIAAVEGNGMEAVDEVLAAAMHEEGFYERVREVYNDAFLTRRYHSSNGDESAAIDLLNRTDYPNANYWDGMDDAPEGAQRFANDAIAEEPLRLLEYILRNDLSYEELITADYTVVNPFSAKVYGVEPDFDDPEDPNEFVKAQLPGMPHAGVTTMPTYLTRYTTTRTNRNRARSRRFQEFFLATDVLALGTRPTDASGSEYANPTMEDKNCVVCHEAVDPIAGTFMNWSPMGEYRPPGHALRGDNVDDLDLLDVPTNNWYTDMRPPGFVETEMPSDWKPAALQWLGSQAVEDPRFALSAVYLAYEGLFGRKPLVEPSDFTAPGYVEAVRAAKVQRQVFRDIADKFAESGFDLRVVFLELVKSPYFRAYNYDGELSEERALELADVGMARLLTPEELNRKILATTDVVWGPLENPNLLDRDEFLILFGGINSDDVNERAYDASGTSANIAKRMSMEVACTAVAQDFAKPATDRKLFPFVEQNYGPGLGSQGALDSIRDNVVFLHEHLLGEYLEADDPAVERTFNLWMDVFDAGQGGLESGDYGMNLPGPCQATTDYWSEEPLEFPVVADENYTIRSWIAVTSYLLTDYEFLHD